MCGLIESTAVMACGAAGLSFSRDVDGVLDAGTVTEYASKRLSWNMYSVWLICCGRQRPRKSFGPGVRALLNAGGIAANRNRNKRGEKGRAGIDDTASGQGPTRGYRLDSRLNLPSDCAAVTDAGCIVYVIAKREPDTDRRRPALSAAT